MCSCLPTILTRKLPELAGSQLRQRGMPVSGSTPQLQSRLLKSVEAEEKKAAAKAAKKAAKAEAKAARKLEKRRAREEAAQSSGEAP